MVYTTQIENLNPSIESLKPNNIYAIGSKSSSDIYVEGSGDYIYTGIWEAYGSGEPDSWSIVDKSNGQMVKKEDNNFINTSVDNTDGIIITVTDNSGGNMIRNILIFVAIIILIILLIGLIVFLVYYFRKKKSPKFIISRKEPTKQLFTL